MAKQKKRRIKNPIARCMELVNRPATHKDKTKYNKKDKGYKKGYDKTDLFYWPTFLAFDKYFNACIIQVRTNRWGMVASNASHSVLIR